MKIIPAQIGIVTIISTPEDFYVKLTETRKSYTVIEEFIAQQVVQEPQQQLHGIQPLQPQLSILMSAVIIIEKK